MGGRPIATVGPFIATTGASCHPAGDPEADEPPRHQHDGSGFPPFSLPGSRRRRRLWGEPGAILQRLQSAPGEGLQVGALFRSVEGFPRSEGRAPRSSKGGFGGPWVLQSPPTVLQGGSCAPWVLRGRAPTVPKSSKGAPTVPKSSKTPQESSKGGPTVPQCSKGGPAVPKSSKPPPRVLQRGSYCT